VHGPIRARDVVQGDEPVVRQPELLWRRDVHEVLAAGSTVSISAYGPTLVNVPPRWLAPAALTDAHNPSAAVSAVTGPPSSIVLVTAPPRESSRSMVPGC
jgi:hypothetical protein